MLAIAPHPVHAAAITRWTQDGVAVCTAAGNQQNPRIVEDGVGGVIIIWQDRRGISEDIYAQRLLAGGTVAPGWPAKGLGVCTAAFGQTEPQLVSDGAGGAIVAWYGVLKAGLGPQPKKASGEVALCTVFDKLGAKW